MTKYLPTNFQKEVSKKLNEIQIVRKILTSEEIKKIIPKFLEFYKNPENEKKIFNDGVRDWVIFETPEEDVNNRPRPAESDFSNNNYLWICKCALGNLNVFSTEEQFEDIGWKTIVLTTGKLTKRYSYIGYKGFYKSLNDMLKDFELDKELLTEDDYNISYSYNLYQIIEIIED